MQVKRKIMTRRLPFFKKLALLLMLPGSALMAENASCAEHLMLTVPVNRDFTIL
jgi:hypothetical protein